MAFLHRKLLLQLVQVARDVPCYNHDCNSDDPSTPPPPPPPPPPATISPILFLMFCVLGAAFLVVCYQVIAAKYRPSFLNSWARRRNPSSLDGTNDEDFFDENHAPLVNHPIWLINTIGLPQSVIDSIAVFKYNRGEGLNEGTECSVCLNEFQEDESLRLLPKCSHAFHILCIDTWLRSHKSCPLCRAPIVYDTNNANLNTTEPTLRESDSRENIRGEILENQAGQDVNTESRVAVENSSALPSEEGKVVGVLEQNSSNLIARNHEVRVLSDLANRGEKMKEELQPVRRSISMDSSSASVIHFGVANMHPMEDEGSDTRQVKKLNTEKVPRRSNGSNSRTYKVTKSSSFGPSDGSNSRAFKVTKSSS